MIQQLIDWEKADRAWINFAICSTDYDKSVIEEIFQRNVEEAHAVGMLCRAYHYSYALTPPDADGLIGGKHFGLNILFDETNKSHKKFQPLPIKCSQVQSRLYFKAFI